MKKVQQKQKLSLEYNLDAVGPATGIFVIMAFTCHWILKGVIDLPPQRDSGCFLYIGQYWLKGMVPYRDMWDHKGPVLYFLNMIGLLINGKTGVLFLQIIMTSLGFLYFFKSINKFINQISAVCISVAGFFMLYFLHQSGNQTEQWSIFFQGISLFLFVKEYENKKDNLKSWILIGFLMACSFLLRPNQIGLWLVIGLFELIFCLTKQINVKTLFLKLLYCLAGFCIPVLAFSLYFASMGAFSNMIDCMFTFNFAYSTQPDGDSQFFTNVNAGLDAIPFSWIILLSISLNLGVYLAKFKQVERRQWLMFLFGVIWLAIEILLSSLRGLGILHYYVQWVLPSLFVLSSFAWSLTLVIKSRQNAIYGQILFSAVLLLLVFNKAKPKRDKEMAEVKSYMENSMFRERVVDKITENTTDSDYVLQWGMVDGINFMAQRKSPTRFFYQYALDTRGYTNEKLVQEFCDDVKNKRPKLIIDASKMERFPELNPPDRDSFYKKKPQYKGLIPSNINEFYKFVEQNYVFHSNVGYMLIYKRKD